MSQLVIPQPIFDEMLSHCREACPNEACGILAGKGRGVLRIYKMGNTERSPVSYLMDSGEQLRVMKEMRADDLSMVAIYHSHPASQAYPSPKDVSLAFYDDAAYVIVSFAGKTPEVKAFSIREGEIREVEILSRELS
jgi:proteasome lid subunit RPN8/RPN11